MIEIEICTILVLSQLILFVFLLFLFEIPDAIEERMLESFFYRDSLSLI